MIDASAIPSGWGWGATILALPSQERSPCQHLLRQITDELRRDPALLRLSNSMLIRDIRARFPVSWITAYRAVEAASSANDFPASRDRESVEGHPELKEIA